MEERARAQKEGKQVACRQIVSANTSLPGAAITRGQVCDLMRQAGPQYAHNGRTRSGDRQIVQAKEKAAERVKTMANKKSLIIIEQDRRKASHAKHHLPKECLRTG
jgi:hypothetical protein